MSADATDVAAIRDRAEMWRSLAPMLGDHCTDTAADLTLLADLLDAIGDLDDHGWPHTDAPTLRVRIAAVLEAHR